MSSTWATLTARGPGSRNVIDVTRVPNRIVEVSRAIPPNVTHASVGPGSPSLSPMATKWSLRKKAPKPSVSARTATASRSPYEAPCWGSVKMRSSARSMVDERMRNGPATSPDPDPDPDPDLDPDSHRTEALVSEIVPGRIQPLEGAPGRIARNVSVASRLALVVALVALVSVVVTSLVGLERGGSLAENEIRHQLSAIGAARADDIERHVAGLERAVVGQALTRLPAVLVDEFSQLFREI